MPRIFTLTVLLVLYCGYGITAQAADAGNVAGHAVFQRWCAGCHADSPLAPGTVALKAARGPASAVLEQRNDLRPILIKTIVRHGFGGMPSFRRTEISVDELEALIAYLSVQSASGVSE